MWSTCLIGGLHPDGVRRDLLGDKQEDCVLTSKELV